MRRHTGEGTGTHVKTTTRDKDANNEVPVTCEVSLVREPRGIWSTLDEMERWVEESVHRPFQFDFGFRPISRLLHDLRGEGELTPTVDIYTSGNEVVVKAELPGMKREEINVRIVDNELLLFGEKTSEERVEEKDYIRLERSYGTFRRTLRLPEGVVTEKVRASFKDGILEVRMPWKVRNEGKTISIE